VGDEAASDSVSLLGWGDAEVVNIERCLTEHVEEQVADALTDDPVVIIDCHDEDVVLTFDERKHGAGVEIVVENVRGDWWQARFSHVGCNSRDRDH
jgi:hypothetical protein